MPDIRCLDPELKDDLVELLRKAGAPKRDITEITKLSACDSGVIELGKSRRGGKDGQKRQPSQYNIFIGDCMRGGKNTLQACAAKWNETKGRK